MMRTLLICTPCHALHGGVERIIESLAARLPAHGFRVVVGLARGERFHLPDRYRLEYPALECVEIDGRSGTRSGRLRGLRRALDGVRPDLVLIARMYDAYEAVWERKKAGDPLSLAVTVQSYEPEYLTDLAAYAPCVDLCVTSGRLVARAVERFSRLPAERIRSIPGGVRPAHRPVRHEARAPLRLGYVGRIEQPQKRILDLATTLSALDRLGIPFTCRVAGTGPAEGMLREALAACGLAARVRFDGWRTTEQLYDEVYPELDVLLHFAAWEGITIAPREAMAHGVVPVVSRFVGCRTEGQFRDGVNALTFDVGDVEEAAACVARLHEDRALLRQLSDQARQSQCGINSDEGAVAAWAEAFAAVLAAPPRIAPPVGLLSVPAGRLDRWGIPPGVSDLVRRCLGRRYRHSDPGGEWPHCSGLAEPDRLREIAAFAAELEAESRVPDVALR
jgi:glycosyltransferase involved in cell wall biosynthesis